MWSQGKVMRNGRGYESGSVKWKRLRKGLRALNQCDATIIE